MSRHINIPVFIPHAGCRHACVFCDQKTITGREDFAFGDAKRQIEEALSTVPEDATVEIAFFGGSFTGIPRDLMLALLELGDFYVKAGRVHGLRCSTRPDYIDEEILAILKKYSMQTVELGIQSISDRVLTRSRRGHTAEDARRAMKLVSDGGFSLIGQMMLGLPSSTAEDECKTAEEICRHADGARVYPIVVFEGTPLADLMRQGTYTPPTPEDLTARAAAVKKIFLSHHVPVIRMGLQSGENLSDPRQALSYYDPAAGERCDAAIYYERIEEALQLCGKNALRRQSLLIETAPGTASKASGVGKENKEKLKKTYGISRVTIRETPDLSPYQVRVSLDRARQCHR